MYSLSSRTYSNDAVQVFAARRPGRKTSNRSTPTPGWVTFRNETCRLANKIASFTFPRLMPAFSRQFKSSSPDTGNLRTTSLSGKLRSLSWAAIVPSALFGRVTYFSSLTVVCAISSISSIIMTISWLPGGAAHLSATVPSSRTRGIYPANGKSEVSSSSIGLWSPFCIWTAPMGIVGWREDVFVSRDLW